MDTKEFYDSLDLDGINSLIENQQEENLYLDFKTMSESPMKKDDNKNFAKSLSGFANSSGGIIVWGVEAKKIDGGPDVASGAKTLNSVKDIISKLNSFTRKFVSPIVEDVEHKEIFTDGSETDGFVVTLIPESSSPPHMVMAGIGKYYKRSGDSFYPTEHFDLADMFGRRPQPVLEFVIEKDPNQSDRFNHKVGIRNIGKDIAKFPFLQIELAGILFEISKYELDGNGNAGLPLLATPVSRPTQRTYGGSVDTVVYPGDTLWITKIRTKSMRNQVIEIPLGIEYKIQCEGMTPIVKTLDKILRRE